MIPTRLIFERIIAVMSAYIGPLLDDPGWDVVPIKAPFVPGPDLVYADLDIDPDWSGTPFPLVASTFLSGWSAETGAITLFMAYTVYFPVFQSTTGTARTVYGFALVEHGGTFVYAANLLAAAYPVDRTGNWIIKAPVSLTFPQDFFVSA